MFVRKKTTKRKKEVLKRSKTLEVKKYVGKIVILFVLSISFLVGFLYWSALSVQVVSVQGADILEPTEIITEVNKILAGEYWYIFPKRHIFIYPKNIIIDELQKQFLRLESVKVVSDDWNSLLIDIKERSSDSIWCKNNEVSSDILNQITEPIATSSLQKDNDTELGQFEQDCYFSDDKGFIFTLAPNFSNSVFIKLSGFLSDQPIGERPLPERSYITAVSFIKNLANIFNETNNNQYRLIKTIIIDDNNYEAIIVDTSKEDNYEWKIFFNNNSVEELVSNFYTILTSESFKKEMLKNQGNLFSIDLRYGKKVFYKFK